MAMAAWRRYRAHPDPRAAAANTLALVLAYNGPLYPIYLYVLVGKAAWPALIALWSVPLFALIPALTRRHSRTGRTAFVLLATLNTAGYVLLFGAEAGLQFFLLPCISLGMLFHHAERWRGRALAAIPLALFCWLRHYGGPPLLPYSPAQFAAMRTLSEVSVATLTWFMVVLFSSMLTTEAPHDAHDHTR